MSDQKDLAYQDYLKGMKYKEIAEKHGVTLNTVKSWKTRYKWSRDGVHTKTKSVHTKKGGQPSKMLLAIEVVQLHQKTPTLSHMVSFKSSFNRNTRNHGRHARAFSC